MIDRLLSIMSDVFKMSIKEIPSDVKPGMIAQWDSLRHLLLIVRLEEEFKIRFTDTELVNLKDFKSILEIINSKLSK
jgi:acyl carrier protein